MASEGRYPELEAKCRDIGHVIGDALPKGVLFGLFLVHAGQGGGFSWISNAQRPDMMKALEEFLEWAKAGKPYDMVNGDPK